MTLAVAASAIIYNPLLLLVVASFAWAPGCSPNGMSTARKPYLRQFFSWGVRYVSCTTITTWLHSAYQWVCATPMTRIQACSTQDGCTSGVHMVLLFLLRRPRVLIMCVKHPSLAVLSHSFYRRPAKPVRVASSNLLKDGNFETYRFCPSALQHGQTYSSILFVEVGNSGGRCLQFQVPAV